MSADDPDLETDPHIAALTARAERRREMLRELAELDRAVALALAKMERAAADARLRREAFRDFDQPVTGGAHDFVRPGAERPTYH